MSLETFIWFAPLLSVIVFSAIEYKYSSHTPYLTQRFKTILILIFITYIVNFGLSMYLLTPVVSIIPFRLLSLSAIEIPSVLKFILCFLLIDFFQYWLHRLHHTVPFLWRLHRLHHSDKQVDAMTTFLHHPLEIVSLFILLVSLYVIVDMPFTALLAYGLIQGLHSGFTHLNMLVPEKVNRYLRNLIITPNTHRLHHSLDIKEGNSNFGQIFIFWDYLFNTYQQKTNEKIQHLTMGIDTQQSPSSSRLWSLLINPLR
jgi:sterol desaturase/sphingolipid hydroxylase (fatty acid hydroxylase superfamily)